MLLVLLVLLFSCLMQGVRTLKSLKNRRGFKRAAAVAFSGLLALGLGLGELPITPEAEAQLPPLPAVPQSSDFQLPQVQQPNLGDIRLPNGQRPGSEQAGARLGWWA